MNNFDYAGAIEEGYTPAEINEFLSSQQPESKYTPPPGDFLGNIRANASNFYESLTGKSPNDENPLSKIDQKLLKKVPNFDVEGALNEGYSPDEINEYLEENAPKRSKLEKAARIGTQFGISALQATPTGLAYEGAVGPLGSKEAQTVQYRENLFDDIERLQEKKMTGAWDEQDQGLLDNLIDQIKNPSKMDEFVHEPVDIGIRGLVEKVTGADLHPEGLAEKAASWAGYLKDPKKLITNAKSIGLNPKELIKTVLPGIKSLKAASAATGWQMAEDGQFGPAGTIGAMIMGDLIGHGAGKGLQGIKFAVTNPKRTLAEGVNLFTRGNSKKKWTEQIIKDANEAGIQLDAGTLTGSNVIKMAQARASQSALSGDALDNFRKDLSNQIVNGYKDIAEKIGDLTFENNFQAADAIKNALKVEEQKYPIFKEINWPARPLTGRVSVEERPLYQQELLNNIAPQEFANDYVAGETLKTAADDIKRPIKEEFNRRWSDFGEITQQIEGPQAELAGQLQRFVAENQGSLLLGESAAESRVLGAAQNLLDELAVGGSLRGVTVADLIKTKRTLADIANWEVGYSDFSSRYKELVGNIDAAIERTLEQTAPELRELYERLNAEYSQFKDVFENKNVQKLFEPKNENYNSIYNSFASDADKLRSLEDMFMNSPRGEELINQVKRDYAQRITSRKDLSDRDLRNLGQVLGPEYGEKLANFARQRQQDIEHPLPRAQTRGPLGVRVQTPQTKPSVNVSGRKIKEANEQVRRKFYEYLKDKDENQILKQMDTVQGIRKMKQILSLTPEGKELFKQLSRFKLEEMIGNKMKHDMLEHAKLGTFSGLLKTSKNKAIVKELVGSEAYNRLRLLQKNAAVLQDSASKFFNASKSGTTVTDVGLISAGIVGVLTGNPFMALNSLGGIAGFRIAANLLADKVFLKYLEEAILTNNPDKFKKLLMKMKPSIQKATLDASKNQMLNSSITDDL